MADPTAKERLWLLRYGAAVLATAAATLLRMALTPLIGGTAIPFITFIPAILFAAWYSGFRAGALSLLLSTLAANYFFVPPVRSLLASSPGDQISFLIFVVVGAGVALLSASQRRAVERADREAVRRREAEEAERVQRQGLETTLASIGDAVIATDAQGRVVFANKVAQSLLRAPEAEVVGKHLDDVFRIVNEFTRATVESPATKVLREGTIIGLANHTVLIALDGTEIPIDDSGSPIRSEGGPVQGTVLVFRDVTARRQAETDSRRLASIIESSDDAIISKDLNGVVTTWNAGAERIFGYRAEEMIGRPIALLAAPDRADEMPGILERIRRGERIDHYQTIRRTKSGTLIHISVTVSPVHDAIGRITGASKIARDITAQVHAQKEAAEQRERLRLTLSSIGDAVIATDRDGQVTYLNPVAEQMTGWTSAEAEGRPLEEVFRIINEHSRMTVESPVARVLREGRIVGLANHTVLISRDGREVFLDDSAAPIRDQGGAIRGAVLVFRDIGERRRMERELHQNTERLRVALEAARMGVWDWNIASGKVNWSPSLEAIHGLPSGGFGGTFEAHLRDVHPDDLASVRQSITRSLQENADHNIEYRILWPDGSIHWIHGQGRVVVDADGNATGMTGLCMDTTGRRQAENALRESEQRFRNLADSAPVLIWVSGPDKKRTWFNRPWLEFTGRRMEQEIDDGWAEGVHPDDLERCQTIYVDSFDRRQPFTREYRLRRHDGQWRWILDRGIPLIQSDGRFLGYIGSCIDIMERKETEEVLRNTNAALQEYADIVDPAAVLVRDTEDRIVRWTSGAQALYGFTAEEAIGKVSNHLFQTGFTEPLEQIRAKLFASGRWEGELRHKRANGGEIVVTSVWALHRDKQGAPTAILEVNSDITERKRMEQELLQLAEIVESSDDAIIGEQLDGTILTWNRGAEKVYGYAAGEVIGRRLTLLAPTGREHEIPQIMERIRKGERIEQYQTKHRRKDGAVIDISLTVSPVKDDTGRITGAAVVARYVTEQRQAEERFRLMVEAAPSGMVVTNESGQIILVNTQTERLFGYSREELIGESVELLVPRRFGAEHTPYLKSFYADASSRPMGEGQDLYARRKDGSEFPVEIGLNPIEASGGQWVLRAIVDITERRRMEQERLEMLAKERDLAADKALHEAQAELARVIRALTVGELATSIAHEVNQPLAAVVTNAEACLRWLSGNTPNLAEAQESLALIVRDGNRASEVIRGIREFLKKEDLQAEPIDINEVVQEGIALARAELLKSRIALRVELSTELPPVLGDRVQLQQVILNLIMNGRDAMASVADRPRELLVTSRKHGDDTILVAVRDSGTGANPQDLDRMFDAFFTTKPTGMGLGLSISRSIIEAHGGRIWAVCNDGPGLTVLFSLPVGRNETPNA